MAEKKRRYRTQMILATMGGAVGIVLSLSATRLLRVTMVRALTDLHAVDLGFTPGRIVTAQVAPRDRPEAFFAELQANVEKLKEGDQFFLGIATHGSPGDHHFCLGERREHLAILRQVFGFSHGNRKPALRA